MRRRAAMACLGAALCAAPAHALGPVGFGPTLDASGWQDMTFRGLAPVDFAVEGGSTLWVRSNEAASLIWRRLPADFAPGSRAAWRWRVDASVPPTDLARRGSDDRSLALYFLFADDAADAADPPRSLRSAMRRGRALIYVWGGSDPRGSVIRSPGLLGRAQMVVKRTAPGPTGQWISETADLRADYRRAFGREPGPLVGIGVSSDSDDTATMADARLSDLVISAP